MQGHVIIMSFYMLFSLLLLFFFSFFFSFFFFLTFLLCVCVWKGIDVKLIVNSMNNYVKFYRRIIIHCMIDYACNVGVTVPFDL